MKKMIYSAKYFLKNFIYKDGWQEYLSVAATFWGIYSSIWAVTKVISETTGVACFEVMFESKHLMIAFVIFLYVIVSHRLDKSYSVLVSNNDLKVGLQVKKIEKIEADSYVIPTNTYFRTSTESDYISLQSVQGAIQEKIFKGKISVLDQLIRNSLDSQGIEY